MASNTPTFPTTGPQPIQNRPERRPTKKSNALDVLEENDATGGFECIFKHDPSQGKCRFLKGPVRQLSKIRTDALRHLKGFQCKDCLTCFGRLHTLQRHMDGRPRYCFEGRPLPRAVERRIVDKIRLLRVQNARTYEEMVEGGCGEWMKTFSQLSLSDQKKQWEKEYGSGSRKRMSVDRNWHHDVESSPQPRQEEAIPAPVHSHLAATLPIEQSTVTVDTYDYRPATNTLPPTPPETPAEAVYASNPYQSSNIPSEMETSYFEGTQNCLNYPPGYSNNYNQFIHQPIQFQSHPGDFMMSQAQYPMPIAGYVTNPTYGPDDTHNHYYGPSIVQNLHSHSTWANGA